MEKLTPFVRIALYYVAGRLSMAGLPPEAVNIIGNDPVLLEVATAGVSLVIVFLTVLWWRIAKHFGWST